jgi:hypothetical protein
MVDIPSNRQFDQLDAVNYVLGAIAVAPVNTLEQPNNRELALAVNALYKEDVLVQSEGWSWNTSFRNFAPDITGRIQIPDNILSASPAPHGVIGQVFYSVNSEVGVRLDGPNLYLYNNSTGDFVFPGPVSLIVRERVEFASLPPAARVMIAAKAAKARNAASLNDARVQNEQEASIMEARLILEDIEDQYQRRHNSLSNPVTLNIFGARRLRRTRGRY